MKWRGDLDVNMDGNIINNNIYNNTKTDVKVMNFIVGQIKLAQDRL